MAKTPWQQWVSNNEKQNAKEIENQLAANEADAQSYYSSVTKDVGSADTSAVFDDEEFSRFVNVNVLKNLSQGLTQEQLQGTPDSPAIDMSFVTGKQSDVGKTMLSIMDYTGGDTGAGQTAYPEDEDGDGDDEGDGPQDDTILDGTPDPKKGGLPQGGRPQGNLPIWQGPSTPGTWFQPQPSWDTFPEPKQGDPFATGGTFGQLPTTDSVAQATEAQEALRSQIERLRRFPPQWVLLNASLMASWPPLKDVGREWGGESMLGIDWDSIDTLAQRYDPNYVNQGDMNIAKLKAEQERNVKSLGVQKPRDEFMQIPGMPEGVGIPVHYDASGKISDINIPKLDQQIDMAIMSGDINLTRNLLNVRDMPSPIEKLNMALEVAKYPASVHQLSQMAAGGPTMDRFGELSPYLADAARGVFGDPLAGLRPQTGDPRTMQPTQSMVAPGQVPSFSPDPMSPSVNQPMIQTPSMGLGGAFIQEAPSDITGAALEDWYERDPYERRPEVGAPGQIRHMYQVAPTLGPTAGMTYEQKIAAGRGDLYGTTSEYVDDPDAEFAARYQSPQYIAEQAELQRINDLAKKYSFAGITSPQPTPSPAPSSTPVWSDTSTPSASGGPLTTPGAVNTTMGANATKTNPVTASIQQAMGERGYFLGNAGTSSPAMPQQFIDPEQERNMFLPTGFTAGLPERVGTVLQGGNPINQPANLLSRPEINLRTPSMQAASRWLPEERQVAEAEMQMRGISPDYLWQSVKQHTPGPAVSNTANRIAGIDFRNRRRV